MRRRVEVSFMMMMLSPVARLMISRIPTSSSSSFPLEGREVLLLLEVREHLIGKEETRLLRGNDEAEAGEVMQLAEHPGEGSLPALVRTRHDDDPLGIHEVERVAHHVRPIEHELVGQGDIERVVGEDLLGMGGNLREQNGNPEDLSRSGESRYAR